MILTPLLYFTPTFKQTEREKAPKTLPNTTQNKFVFVPPPQKKTDLQFTILQNINLMSFTDSLGSALFC